MSKNPAFSFLVIVSSLISFLDCGGPEKNPEVVKTNSFEQPSSSGYMVLRIIDGDEQSGTVGELLPNNLTVEARNGAGFAVEGRTVRFSITHGAGLLSNANTVTDSKGVASTNFRLGAFTGDIFIRAELLPNEIANFSQIVGFKVKAIAGPPTMISVEDGDDQCTIANTIFPSPLLLKVQDSYGNAIPFLSLDGLVSNGLFQKTVATAATFHSDENGSTIIPIKAGDAPSDIDPNGSPVTFDFNVGPNITKQVTLRTTRGYYFLRASSDVIQMHTCCLRCFCLPPTAKIQVLNECNRPWTETPVRFKPSGASTFDIVTDKDGFATYSFIDYPCGGATSCAIEAYHPIHDPHGVNKLTFTVLPPN